MSKAGVPSGVRKAPPEVIQHAQLAYRNTIGSIENVTGMAGPLNFLGAGFLVDGAPTTPQDPPPRLGEHTREVLATLGYADATIQALLDKKIVSCPDDA